MFDRRQSAPVGVQVAVEREGWIILAIDKYAEYGLF